jgi:tetratricopeptide (TPR) repeat protein
MTPFVNGAVEGTEFLVRVDETTTTIQVFKGRVTMANANGRLSLASGQAGVAPRNQAPRTMAVVHPLDAIQWTLYYPSIIDSTRGSSAEGLRRGSLLLASGQVQAAKKVIAGVLRADPGNATALALQSIIMVVRNEKARALELAERAVLKSPENSAALLALSYARQARFEIREALATLKKATALHQDNGLLMARLAELYLSVGRHEQALQAAEKAIRLAPRTSRAHAVLGFVHLARIEPDLAVTAFTKAITLDPAMPLARLGLGLALIRQGRLEEGRADLEVAAALNPASSLLRSYLGKAFYEEKRDDRAAEQYRIAKRLDPMDPTPWLYDALNKQAHNRPVEALADIEESIRRNDNRAVYRSRLLLDEDLAARSTSLGRIFTDLGFSRAALAEGWKSVNLDPSNYSAHRFLADSYINQPRHEIARVSELLQSQLLQPLNMTPVQPLLAESNRFASSGIGLTTPSFNEFNPLFERNGFRLLASAAAGNDSTFGDELTHSAIWNKTSYSLGQFHYETDGIRPNNDEDINIYNAYVQTRLSPATSLLTELRYRKKSYGDLVQRFERDSYDPTISQEDTTKSIRIGGSHHFSTAATLIGTFIYSNDDNDADGLSTSDGMNLAIEGESDSYMGEVQYLFKKENFDLITGAGYVHADETDTIIMADLGMMLSEQSSKTEHTTLYAYSNLSLPMRVLVTIGCSADFQDSMVDNKEQFNPKFGLTWQPAEATTVRAAVFRTLQRRMIYAQTVEPTQVAGFNQFYDDFEATDTWQYGIGLDQKLPGHAYTGVEYTYRDMDVPFMAFRPETGSVSTEEDDWREQMGRWYLYWPVADSLALTADYFYEHLRHEQWDGPQGVRKLTTHRIVPGIRYFHPSGLTAEIAASYIDQQGDFFSFTSGYQEKSDSFWSMDAALTYRLPRRMGLLRLEVTNLFDTDFNYLDTDLADPHIQPERQIVGSFTLSF